MTRRLAVRVCDDLGQVPAAGWDEVVEAAGAPIFYRHRYLSAYVASRLAGAEASACVVATRGGRPVAVAPAFLMSGYDPLRVLEPLLEGEPERPRRLLVSHAWHCYDSTLPAIDAAALEALCARMVELAREWGADGVAVVNVDAAARPELDSALRALGFRGAVVETRYRRALVGLTTDAYVDGLPRSPRRTLRRYQRRGEDAGVRVELLEPPLSGLDEFLDLCAISAAKHGNAAYYPRAAVETVVRGLEPHVRLVRLRDGDGSTIAGSICLHDPPRFHSWAGGARYELGRAFSPNYLLFLAEIETALRLGCAVFEAGRRSDEFKRRYGMEPVPLTAYLRIAAP
ncbi:MAG TPA: GNAT family N-acetyltransferase [Candidatus Dormibacteraeota bacterium]|nr:GNAT family N-acetyltransferase [Candidatus Dormibacteraeota bacterium]